MIIRIVGTGAALNTDDIGSSILIDNKILIDSPPGVQNRLLKYNVDLTKINISLISHMHGDHYFGLPFLLLEYGLHKRERELIVYGPEGLYDNTYKLLEMAFPDYITENLMKASKSRFDSIRCGNILTFEDYSIEVVKAFHPITTFGFIIKHNDNSVYFSSDTSFSLEIEECIKKADSIFIDGTTVGFALKGHMDAEEIGTLANKYPDKKFYVMHRSRYVAPQLHNMQNLFFPREGDIIEL